MPADRQTSSPTIEAKVGMVERGWLLLVLLLILGCAGSGVCWVIATKRQFAAATQTDPTLGSQRGFLEALSASMASSVTVVCDARGTLTADVSRDCLLTATSCVGSILVGLDVHGQGFTGAIPEIAPDAIPAHLRSLDVSGNRLSGSIPTTIGRLANLT
jgi:hypothetical protein